MPDDKLWVQGEMRRLTKVSETMLAGHHRAEGQLIVYRRILQAMEAEERDARSQRVPSPDDTKQGV